MSKTFWMTAAILFATMTAISQWHLNTNAQLHKAETDDWLYVTKSLADKLSDELLYNRKLESIITEFELVPATPEPFSSGPATSSEDEVNPLGPDWGEMLTPIILPEKSRN